MLNTILLVAFLAVVLVQLFYYFYILGSFSFAKNKQNPPALNTKISVLCCFKNNLEDAKKLIPLLLNQKNVAFELVIIDNNSTDDDASITFFEQIEKENTNVKLVKVENNEAFWGNKKYALTLGIKAASNEKMAFIKPNYEPASENWLAILNNSITPEKQIILGYTAIKKKKNNLKNKIIRFENLLYHMQMFGYVQRKKPTFAANTNLAYTKKNYFDNQGFMNHMKIRLGEADLFVNEAGTKTNTTYTIDAEARVIRKNYKKYSTWLNDIRKRNYTTRFYNKTDQFTLNLFLINKVLFYTLLTVLLILQQNLIITCAAALLSIIVSGITIGYSTNKLKEKDLLYWFPFLEIIIVFITLKIKLKNAFIDQDYWK